VTSQENWDVIKGKKVWGVSERYRRKMEKINAGDFLVFYVKKQGLAGIFKVVSEVFEDRRELFEARKEEEAFPLRVKLEVLVLPKKTIPFETLAKKSKFFSQGPWALQLAMREISKDEYEKIRALLS
jgi:predicted RNA-binding protein